MPFTVSHVAAVLPLTRRDDPWLPVAPLVIGSMTPDLPTAVGLVGLRSTTHHLLAVPTLDVAVTGVLWLLWVAVLRPVAADLLPALAARWRPEPARSRPVLRWYLAAVVGGLTHVVWDACTHVDEGIGRLVPALHGQDGLFIALQLTSSALGLLVLAWWALRWWRRAEPVAAAARWPLIWPSAVVVALTSVAVAAVRHERVQDALAHHRYQRLTPTGAAVFGSLAGALAGVVVLALAYRAVLLVRSRPAQRRP